MIIKTITLWQPWATLVVIGAKSIETRSWHTLHRGTLAIHASKRFMKEDRRLCLTEPFVTALEASGIDPVEAALGDLPTGCVLGTVELFDCLRIGLANMPGLFHGAIVNYLDIRTVEEPELSFGLYESGRFAWMLMNPKPFATPIPAKGRLGLWPWEEAALTGSSR